MHRLKKVLSRVPGVIVAHGLGKNARHKLRPGIAIRGGIARRGLDPARATAYVTSIFTKVDDFVAGHGGWQGKRVLEVGPGDSLGTGLLALAHGAGTYDAIDGFRVRFDPSCEREVFARLRATLTAEEAERVADIQPFPGPGVPDAKRRLAYANDLPLERAPQRLGTGVFDVIFSNAVLAQVAEPVTAARALGALLAPGGVMLHDIDLRSHQTYEVHPLQFLTYPQWLWRLMSSHCGQPNRARMDDWLSYFTAAGLEIHSATVTEEFATELVANVIPRLAEPFRNLAVAQLKPAVIIVTAGKPG